MPARHVADMQLDSVIVLRRVGHGEISAVAVGKQELQILSCLGFSAYPDREAQIEDADIRRGPDQPEDGRCQPFASKRAVPFNSPGQNFYIAARLRPAKEHPVS